MSFRAERSRPKDLSFELSPVPMSVTEGRGGRPGIRVLGLLEAKLDRAKSDQLVSAAAEAAPIPSRPTSRLGSFRRRTYEPKIVDLNHRIISNLELIRRSLGETIRLTTLLGCPAWKLWVCPGEIDDMLLTIAINAREVMSGGGRLVIETRNV